MTYLVLPLFIIMGWTGYNLRNSSLYKNVKTTGQKNRSFYLGQILTIILIGNILSGMFFLIMAILSPFSIFSNDWGILNKGTITIEFWRNGAWINFIYITQVTILLTFAIYFMLNNFMNNERTYYIVVVSLYLLGIIFSGSLNNYYGVPWWKPVLDRNDLGVVFTDQTNFEVATIEQFEMIKSSITTAFDERTMEIAFNLFPDYLFGPTLLFPYFGVGQFTTTTVFAQSIAGYNNSTDATITILETGEVFKLADLTGYGNSWNYFSLSFTKDTWQWTMIILQPYIWILVSFIIGTTFTKINQNK